MNNNFQKSIVPIDEFEEELESWKQLSTITSNLDTFNHSDYLVCIDPEDQKHYLSPF